jgi:hypothetical protein
MLLPTTCDSIRAHSTSWKNATAPASSMSGSTQPVPGKSPNTGVRGRRGGTCDSGTAGSPSSEYPLGGAFGETRLASATASRNTMPLSIAATQTVRARPSSGNSMNAASSAPSTAPAVFKAYSMPMRRPTCASSETA